MALTDKLTAIGNAIRAKDGSTALLTLDEMPIAIAAIETPSTPGGSESGLPEEAFLITGNCSYKFSSGGWNWFIENYGNKITTKDITDISYMFYNNKNLTDIPFTINLKSTDTQGIPMKYAFMNCENLEKVSINFAENTYVGDMDCMFQYCIKLNEISDMTFYNTTAKKMSSLFNNCSKLKVLPYIYNAYPSEMNAIFQYCNFLRDIPEDYFDTWNFDYINTNKYANCANVFSDCKSLRKVPKKVLDKFGKETIEKSYYYSFYSSLFYNCYALDEITDLPVCTYAITSNVFSNTNSNCGRLKNFTFETNEDGSAKTAQWKGQSIFLNNKIGYGCNFNTFKNYNTGITEDKMVDSKESYEALKNDPDWFAYSESYSRYNHDSAVATINSLPDTSAYLAANGGTNTINFKSYCGDNTDGGSVSKLTAEEIAVATAKGWTVTLK